MVQEFDPPGTAARDLPECLLMQLKVIDPQNTLAQQIIAEHLKLLQNNQLKEVARALNRPVELVKRAVDVIVASIRSPACATTRRSRVWSSPTCNFEK